MLEGPEMRRLYGSTFSLKRPVDARSSALAAPWQYMYIPAFLPPPHRPQLPQSRMITTAPPLPGCVWARGRACPRTHMHVLNTKGVDNTEGTFTKGGKEDPHMKGLYDCTPPEHDLEGSCTTIGMVQARSKNDIYTKTGVLCCHVEGTCTHLRDGGTK